MRGLVAARLRHQPAQAALVTLLAAVVSLSAVLGVAYAQAVERSVQHQTLADAPVSASGMSVSVTGAPAEPPQQLRGELGDALDDPVWGALVTGASADGLLVPPAGKQLVSVVVRDGLCKHLTIVQGACLGAADDASDDADRVLVSSRTLVDLHLTLGDRLPIADGSGNDTTPVFSPKVVGVYQPYEATRPYWFDRSMTREAVVGTKIAGGDTVFVSWRTLSSAPWRSVTTTVDVPLALTVAGWGDGAEIRAATSDLARAARSANARTSTQLPPLLEAAARQQHDARAALPLLALQIVVLSLVVLAYVAAATIEQRRSEVALARLRGQQPAAAAGLLVRELGMLVVTGAVLGGLAGWGLAKLAALVWLVPGTPVPLRWSMLVAAAAAAVAGLVAAVVVAVPTVREPLVSLLRSVPPRSSALRAGVGDGVIVALCAAGLVTLLSGDPGDPSALVAPGLLALSGGLVLSQVIVPVAGVLGGKQLHRGRLRSGLAAVAVSRRPSLRRMVAIVAVAVALLVFAAASDAVARDQRRVGGGQRAGAPVVLTVSSRSAHDLQQAVSDADPSHAYATPVLLARSSNQQGPRTLAVDPETFGRFAFWDRSQTPGSGAPSLTPLLPPKVASVPVTGATLRAQVSLDTSPIQPNPDEQFMLWYGYDPPEDGLHALLTLSVDLQRDGAGVVTVPLGTFKPGATQLSAGVPCADGCLLRRINVERPQGDLGGAALDVKVGLRDSDGDVNLRAADGGWSAIVPFTPVELTADGDDRLVLRNRSFGTGMGAQRQDVPRTLPALVTAGIPPAPYTSDAAADATQLVEAPAATGGLRVYEREGALTGVPGARAPDGAPAPTVLVSFDLATAEAPLTSGVTQQVWLGRDDSAREARLVHSLRESGVRVLERTSAADEAERLASQGSGLALRLALLVGGIALVLAAFVLGVAAATSGRIRAHDLAGLRLVGVSRRVVAAAAVREQLLVALVGVVSGALLGGAGAALMLSRQPATGVLPAPDIAVAWPAALVAVVLAALVLGGVCLVLGWRLARRAVPDLLAEGTR